MSLSIRTSFALLLFSFAVSASGTTNLETPVAEQGEADLAVSELEKYFGESQLEALAVLSNMTQAEWQVFDFLVSADSRSLEKFYREFEGVEKIYILPDGSFSPVAPEYSDDWELIKVASQRNVLDQVRGLVSSINRRTTDIQSRLPNNAPVRNLFSEIPLPRLREMISLVVDEIGPILDFLRTQRDGFEDFRDFRMGGFILDINVMLDNLVTLWEAPQEFVCLRRPDYEPRPLDLARIRGLVAKAPPLLLYGMETALKDIEFDWQLTELASELVIDPICETSAPKQIGVYSIQATAADATIRQRYRMRRCKFFTRGEGFFAQPADVAVSRAEKFKAQLDFYADFLDQFEKKTKDDQTVAVTAVAVGGAGAGVSVKNPIKVVAVTATFIVGRLETLLGDALAIRKECEDQDSAWEGDLLSCSAKVSYILPNARRSFGEQAYLDDLVERRIAEVQDAGLLLNRADEALEEARAELDSREAFVCLCDAYQRLVLPESEIPVVDCVESP